MNKLVRLSSKLMDAFAVHSTMSNQALDSEKVRSGLRDILRGPAKLYEALRERSNCGLDNLLSHD